VSDKPSAKGHGDLDRFVWTGEDITVHRKSDRKADKKTSATLRPDVPEDRGHRHDH
jgi:hypothetical protein